MVKVFMSYSVHDRPFAERLSADLQKRGIHIWQPGTLMPGTDWLKEISEHIAQADVYLFLVSRASVQSAWLQSEVGEAIQSMQTSDQKRLIPVLIEDTPVPEMLQVFQWADLRDHYEIGVSRIARAISTVASEGISGSHKNLFSDTDVKKIARQIVREVLEEVALTPADSKKSGGIPVPPAGNLVFVICPFSADMDPVFEGIEAAAQSFGLAAKRVKDVKGDYRITDKILEMIRDARFVVADLTHERPNVYFELGYARGLQKTVITTAREGTVVHFDVKDWTCEFYSDSRVLERALRGRFAAENQSAP